jgi:hypothetical protein
MVLKWCDQLKKNSMDKYGNRRFMEKWLYGEVSNIKKKTKIALLNISKRLFQQHKWCINRSPYESVATKRKLGFFYKKWFPSNFPMSLLPMVEDEHGEGEKALNISKLIVGELTIENWWCDYKIGSRIVLFKFGGLLF